MLKNSVIKVCWSQTQMQLSKITNKMSLLDQRYSIPTRAQTAEDEEENMYTDCESLANVGYLGDRILRALLEIHNHIKKNSDILLIAGTFYFKLDDAEKPVLLFAT